MLLKPPFSSEIEYLIEVHIPFKYAKPATPVLISGAWLGSPHKSFLKGEKKAH